jgi:hypothetical protein
LAAALLQVTGGFFNWRSKADCERALPALTAAVAAPNMQVDLSGPPKAIERTREARRFTHDDKGKSGPVAGKVYLQSRRKTLAKLCVYGDDNLGAEEYMMMTTTTFAARARSQRGVESRQIRADTYDAKIRPKVRMQAGYAGSVCRAS